MPVRPGGSLGSYDVLSELGAGGMGQVYRARDRKLGRDVAIKIVHPRLAGDVEHLERFKREAHALAALNHVHIGAVHELDEADGVVFLVMELVEGETLQDRLAAGPMGTTEALRLCSQVAAALEAAHEKGIVHRDLKPANIKITPEGVVKVLDFGLAKTLRGPDAGALSQSPTAADMTSGVVLGTAAYMSPEQARGRPVDRRTDVWSFGCILFEVLTGRRPFAGETVSDAIARILEREPDWRLLPDATPAGIQRLLRRCLQKDLHNRLHDIGDARLEIDEALSGGDVAAAATQATWRAGRMVRPMGWLALGAVAGIAIGAMLRTGPQRAPQPAAHFVVPLPPAERLAALDFPAVAISPDGSRLAYIASRGGRPQLFVRSLDKLEPTAVPGTADASGPFFSPDQRWLAFFAEGKLKKVPLAGGAPVTICDAPIGFGGSWGAGDVIVFAATSGSGLSQVSAADGKPTRATTLDTQKGEFSHRWPEVLPGGDTVLFTVGTVGSWDDAQIVGQSLRSGRRQLLVQGGTHPHYVSTGHLLYTRGGAVMAVPFDAAQIKVTGTPVRLLENVLESFDGAAQASVSQSGHIVYVPGSFGSAARLLMGVDRAGAAAPFAAPPRAYSTPRVSPDGRLLALTIAGTTEDVWIYDITQGTLKQLTFDANTSSPAWTPDGQHVTFSSNKDGPPNLFWTRADGTGVEEKLASSDDGQVPGSWAPDSRLLAFVDRNPTTGRDIWVVPRDDRRPSPLLRSPFDESAPRFSPDGRWIAYVSNETGQSEVYVCALADPTRTRRLTSGGGAEPVWARGGRELYYRARDRMMAVSVDLTADVRRPEPRVLFKDKFEKGTLDTANYDVTPDGQRFVLIKSGEPDAVPQELHVVLNWVEAMLPGASPRR